MKERDAEPGLGRVVARRLMDEARAAAVRAYAPYSGFRVGAAVLGRSEAIYRGANVENASLGLGTCAERVALASAVADGERDIVAMAIACVDAPAGSPLERRAPCGACRQWMRELAPQGRDLHPGREPVLPHRRSAAPGLLPGPRRGLSAARAPGPRPGRSGPGRR